MKKVFAFLSVFALTIAFVGFGAKSANAAGDLFTEDPTLSENQIPMYIMDSIYTTFPNYYDYAVGGDENWGGAARMYPWNETRLDVKLIDEDGNFVKAANGLDTEYAIYFSGATTASSSGTGNNLLFYVVDDNGAIQLKRLSGGKYNADGSPKWDSSGLPMDPSLSHLRTNVSDQTIKFDAIELWQASANSTDGSNQYNRQLTFDGQGRMIRGVALDGGYLLPDAEGAQAVTIAPEYCYVDGVVEKIGANTVCDVEVITDEETGETTETTQYITNRFVWQYFTAEEFDPESVNTVPYLSEGWDAMKWDYVNEEEDGYVCIAFVSSEGGNFKLTADQLQVYTETCAANGLPEPAADTVRKPMREIIVPAGGWTYDFGYLDKGKPGLCAKFMDMFIDGYYYGRKVDENGNGMGRRETVDFSTSPIYAKDIQNNGVSYQVMDGQNVIEVLQGEIVYPTKNVVYSGMAKYWQEAGNFLSYTQDTSVLELVVKQDGITVVQPNTGYNSHKEMAEDFMKDFNAFYAKKQGYTLQADGSYAKEDGSVYAPLATPTLPAGATADDAKAAIGGTSGAWYKAIPYNLVGLSTAEGTFVGDAEMWAKWSWMFEYMNVQLAPVASELNLSTKVVASPGNWAYTMWCFLAEAPLVTGWPSSKVDWSNGVASAWCDTRTNVQKWDEYSIDTTTAAIDTNYVVEFAVYNPNTGLETTLKLTYVVVDEYTPILTVNKNNLIFSPKVVGEKVEMPVIDEYTFCNAYNARYNGSAIKGDDISYKVHYYSETLDFDNPTEGDHVVTAKVYNQTKWVEKSFVVSIEDVTAPRVATVSVTLGVGEYFNPLMGVIYAYDNVDGNLLDMTRDNWFSLGSKVDVQTVGKYSAVVEIWDEAGNTVEVKYDVNVVSNKVNTELADGIKANKQAIENVEGMLVELQEQVAAIQAEFDAKCGSKNAVLVSFLAATSLLVVFLRKKH